MLASGSAMVASSFAVLARALGAILRFVKQGCKAARLEARHEGLRGLSARAAGARMECYSRVSAAASRCRDVALDVLSLDPAYFFRC